MPDAMDYLIAGYAFVVGSIVGSFLNVVVARVPEGRNIAHPPSSCPVCGHRIRIRDNIPIFGWLMLKGRCRDCGVRIPFRYPAVELLTALLFLVLVYSEVLTVPNCLPVGLQRDPAGVVRMGAKPYANPVLWRIYLLHISFFCVLLSTALMEVDRKTPPRSLLTIAILLGSLVSTLWPDIHPVSFSLRPAVPTIAAPLLGLFDALAGAAVGAGIGWGIARTADSLKKTDAGQKLRHTPDAIAECWILEHALVGVVFGWQTSVFIAVVAACARFIGVTREWLANLAFPQTVGGSLWLASLMAAICWAKAIRFFWWPGSSLALAVGAILMA